MGPVSEEPGLSLWDAMSVLCPARAGRGAGGRGLGGREGGRTHHSVGNPPRSAKRKGGIIKQQAHSPRGRRASARGREPGPPCAPREEGAPRNGLKGQPAPPNCKLAASAQVLGSRRPPAGRPWPGALACQSSRAEAGASEPGVAEGRGMAGPGRAVPGNRCGGGPHSCRPERRGAPRRRRQSWPACVGGQETPGGSGRRGGKVMGRALDYRNR